MADKARDAFRTISEVSEWLDLQPHVLRFWESKFSQIKPIKRAGGRRYYRPADMELIGGIRKLLHDDGMTIKGVQKLLREKGVKHVAALSPSVHDGASQPVDEAPEKPAAIFSAEAPRALRPIESPEPEPQPMPLFSHRREPSTVTQPSAAPSDVDLIAALRNITPGTLPAERLRPIYSQLVALRDKMAAAG